MIPLTWAIVLFVMAMVIMLAVIGLAKFAREMKAPVKLTPAQEAAYERTIS